MPRHATMDEFGFFKYCVYLLVCVVPVEDDAVVVCVCVCVCPHAPLSNTESECFDVSQRQEHLSVYERTFHVPSPFLIPYSFG